MPDREKVIKRLQEVANICALNGDIQSMMTIGNALSLLKLQSPVWIPVSERLPETRRFVPHGPISSSKVLFKTSDKTIHLGYLIKDSYVDKYAGETILQRWYDDHGDRIENVTEWCEPPKGEDDG